MYSLPSLIEQALSQLVKGYEMAMLSAVLLAGENKKLRTENKKLRTENQR
jgi:hypothetical protein